MEPVRVKGRSLQKCMQFKVECDLVQYENKVETTNGIHVLNLQSENSPKGVQQTS
jgi:hypothetical protein